MLSLSYCETSRITSLHARFNNNFSSCVYSNTYMNTYLKCSVVNSFASDLSAVARC